MSRILFPRKVSHRTRLGQSFGHLEAIGRCIIQIGPIPTGRYPIGFPLSPNGTAKFIWRMGFCSFSFGITVSQPIDVHDTAADPESPGIYLAVALMFITKLFDLYRLSTFSGTLLIPELIHPLGRLVAIPPRGYRVLHILLDILPRLRPRLACFQHFWTSFSRKATR